MHKSHSSAPLGARIDAMQVLALLGRTHSIQASPLLSSQKKDLSIQLLMSIPMNPNRDVQEQLRRQLEWTEQDADDRLESLKEWALRKAQFLIPNRLNAHKESVIDATPFVVSKMIYETQSYDSHVLLNTPIVISGLLRGQTPYANGSSAFELSPGPGIMQDMDLVEIQNWSILLLEALQWDTHQIRVPHQRNLMDYRPIQEHEWRALKTELHTLHPEMDLHDIDAIGTWLVLRRPFIVLDRVDGIPYVKVYEMAVPREAVRVLSQYRELLSRIKAEFETVTDLSPTEETARQAADGSPNKTRIDALMRTVFELGLDFQHPILLRAVWLGITSDNLETTRSFLIAEPASAIEIQSFRRETAFYLPATMTIHGHFNELKTVRTRFLLGPPLSWRRVVEMTRNASAELIGNGVSLVPVTQAYASLALLPTEQAKRQTQARRRLHDYKTMTALLVIEGATREWRALMAAAVASETQQTLFLGAKDERGQLAIKRLHGSDASRQRQSRTMDHLYAIAHLAPETPEPLLASVSEQTQIRQTTLHVVSRFFPVAARQDPVEETWTPQGNQCLLLMLNTTSLLVTGTIAQMLQAGVDQYYHKFLVRTVVEAAPVRWNFTTALPDTRQILLLTTENQFFLTQGAAIYYSKSLGRTVIVDRFQDLFPADLPVTNQFALKSITSLFTPTETYTHATICFAIGSDPSRLLVLYDNWRFLTTCNGSHPTITQEMIRQVLSLEPTNPDLIQSHFAWLEETGPVATQFDVEHRDPNKNRAREGSILQVTLELTLPDGEHLRETVTIRILTVPIVPHSGVYLMSLVEGVIGVEIASHVGTFEREDQLEVMRRIAIPSARMEMQTRERSRERVSVGLPDPEDSSSSLSSSSTALQDEEASSSSSQNHAQMTVLREPRGRGRSQTRILEYQNLRLRVDARSTEIPIPRLIRTIALSSEERQHLNSAAHEAEDRAERNRREQERRSWRVARYLIPMHQSQERTYSYQMH